MQGIEPEVRRRLEQAKRMLVCDIDDTLVAVAAGHPGKAELDAVLRERADDYVFVVATGRSLPLIFEVLDEHGVPDPDVLVGSVGTELYYGKSAPVRDTDYDLWMSQGWERDAVVSRLRALPWLEAQRQSDQNAFKASYLVRAKDSYRTEDVLACLGELAGACELVWSHGRYLDVLPRRSSKGGAVRYLAERWGMDLARSVTAGDSGNDRTMLQGETCGIVVGGYVPELEDLRNTPRVYFAQSAGPAGVLEGLRHHEFL